MPSAKTTGSKRPVSARQLAANRANARRSTGPRTPEGKARSAQNARRHAFTPADYSVVRLEDLEAVARLKDDLVAVYQPVNSQELFAIERIALTQHALLRCARLESGLFTTSLNEALDRTGNPIVPMTEDLVGDLEITRAQNRNYALAEGFRRIAREGNTWTLFLRYQAQTERLYRRAIEELERLKALRHELPDEPDLDGQPEEKPTSSIPPETNPIEPPGPPPAPAPVSRETSARGPASSERLRTDCGPLIPAAPRAVSPPSRSTGRSAPPPRKCPFQDSEGTPPATPPLSFPRRIPGALHDAVQPAGRLGGAMSGRSGFHSLSARSRREGRGPRYRHPRDFAERKLVNGGTAGEGGLRAVQPGPGTGSISRWRNMILSSSRQTA